MAGALSHLADYATIISRQPAQSKEPDSIPSHHNPHPGEDTLLSRNGSSTSAVSLLGDGELDTLALGQRDPWLLGSDDENVVLTGSERVVYGVLDVNNVEASVVALAVGDDTNATHVATTSGHGDDSGVELDELGDLAGGQVDLDGVVDLDGWVRVTDAMSLVST